MSRPQVSLRDRFRAMLRHETDELGALALDEDEVEAAAMRAWDEVMPHGE